jgi:mannose-6-phosphate isomerase-like protein (cupin superfamily)
MLEMTNGLFPHFDSSSFQTLPYVKRVEKPWGWELLWTPEALPYVGKVLHLFEGHRLSLQMHEDKHESWLLVSGRAKVVWENQHGELEECELIPGQGYSCASGQKHRLAGITECDIIEVSTPEVGVTWRIEDDYGRTHEMRAEGIKDA